MEPLLTSYAVTPVLPVEAVQDRRALVEATLEEPSPEGAVGARVSELDRVVQTAWALLGDTSPAASRANTDRRYRVAGDSPVSALEVAFPGASPSLLPSL